MDKYGDGREWDTTAIGVWIKQGVEVRRQWKLVSVQLDSKEAAEKNKGSGDKATGTGIRKGSRGQIFGNYGCHKKYVSRWDRVTKNSAC